MPGGAARPPAMPHHSHLTHHSVGALGNLLPIPYGTSLAVTTGDIARSPIWQAGRQPTSLAGGALGLPTALYGSLTTGGGSTTKTTLITMDGKTSSPNTGSDDVSVLLNTCAP